MNVSLIPRGLAPLIKRKHFDAAIKESPPLERRTNRFQTNLKDRMIRFTFSHLFRLLGRVGSTMMTYEEPFGGAPNGCPSTIPTLEEQSCL